MNRGIEPLKVAPLIRGARYSFLIAGWFYGVSKKSVYTKIEAVAAPRRKAAHQEENKIKAKLIKENNIEDIKNICENFGCELEPGWEKFI